MIAKGAGLVHLELSEPAPVEAAAGSDIVVQLRASCSSGRERCGMAVRLVAPDGAEARHALTTHSDDASETGDIVLKVPPRVGEQVWRFVLPAHEIDGVRYGESALAVSVRAVPQTTSLAVWQVPSPVVVGERFRIRAGAKSSAGCDLKGRSVEVVRDGAVVARAVLGDAPLQGTSALYWTELEVAAPEDEGICSWSVRFDASDLELPHDGTASAFSLAVVRPPEHTLTVKVVERDTADPVVDALVRLGAYRAETGRAGFAEIRLPKGRYELHVWKAGYDIEPTVLDLQRDASIEVRALAVPEEDPDARWKM